MTDAELRELITMEVTRNVSFLKFPCHTKAVERCVKLVTEAAKTVWTEFVRWLHPCMRSFSTANVNI